MDTMTEAGRVLGSLQITLKPRGDLAIVRNSPTSYSPFFSRGGVCSEGRAFLRRILGGLLWPSLMVMALPSLAWGLTVEQLHRDASLTPKKFSRLFADFEYELERYIQPAEVFLRREKGDCDDYTALADSVLAPKGFETRLVQVRLAGLTSHAVCYVTESKAYLDYNNRQVFFTMTRSSPALRQIAEKVARSLNANWTVAFEYEFSYEDSRKRIMARVVRVRDPRHDPPPQKARPQADRLLVE
jgi:hypothetical protein